MRSTSKEEQNNKVSFSDGDMKDVGVGIKAEDLAVGKDKQKNGTNRKGKQKQTNSHWKLAVGNKRVCFCCFFFFSRRKHKAHICKQIPFVAFGIENRKRKIKYLVPTVENCYPMVHNLENSQMASMKILTQSFTVGSLWIIKISWSFTFCL